MGGNGTGSAAIAAAEPTGVPLFVFCTLKDKEQAETLSAQIFRQTAATGVLFWYTAAVGNDAPFQAPGIHGDLPSAVAAAEPDPVAFIVHVQAPHGS